MFQSIHSATTFRHFATTCSISMGHHTARVPAHQPMDILHGDILMYQILQKALGAAGPNINWTNGGPIVNGQLNTVAHIPTVDAEALLWMADL